MTWTLLLRNRNAAPSLYNRSKRDLHGNCQEVLAALVLFTVISANPANIRLHSIELNQVAVI